ncbi:MAG TPA: hypothetical protein VJM69_03785 [Dehalococcoidia bacterium]|nr:hypothetical protein [Dehalococcoidia bacterium]
MARRVNPFDMVDSFCLACTYGLGPRGMRGLSAKIRKRGLILKRDEYAEEQIIGQGLDTLTPLP